MDNAQKRQIVTKKVNEYTSAVTPGQTTKLGPDEVKHYYRVFVNREPDETELKVYVNHPDNKQLLKDLSMQRKDAMDMQKKEEQAHQQGQQYGGGQGGPILNNFSNILSSGASRIGQSINTALSGAHQTVRNIANAAGNVINNITGNKRGFRTDRNNNPTAFTTDVARSFGLIPGVDYVVGDKFPGESNLYTAKLLGDPIATTIKGIDRGGFYTQSGKPRWTYTTKIPGINNWANLTYGQKANIIAQMYKHEGGSGELVKKYLGTGGSSMPASLGTLGNITTNFGDKTRDTNFHTGVDIANREGTPITKFGGSGQVVASQPNGDYGNQITIKNDDGTTETYSHLKQAYVRPGQRVQGGQPVAAMGHSGNSYSPTGGDPSHLHYEIVDAYNRLINPMSYLRK